MPLFTIESGGYKAQVEADTPEEATRLAFLRQMPHQLAFAVKASTPKANGKQVKSWYMYAVNAYKLAGVDAYLARKNLVLPVRKHGTFTGADITGANSLLSDVGQTCHL